MAEDFNQLLYEKAVSEYEDFLKQLQDLSVEEIIKRSYEKVYKEELVSILETASFTKQEAESLCGLDHLLEALYQEWLGNDYSCVELLEQTIRDLAGEFI